MYVRSNRTLITPRKNRSEVSDMHLLPGARAMGQILSTPPANKLVTSFGKPRWATGAVAPGRTWQKAPRRPPALRLGRCPPGPLPPAPPHCTCQRRGPPGHRLPRRRPGSPLGEDARLSWARAPCGAQKRCASSPATPSTSKGRKAPRFYYFPMHIYHAPDF